MSDKITRLPNLYKRNKRIRLQQGKLACVVSERWIQFPNGSDKYTDMDYLRLDVMTKSSEGKDRKLCEIIVDRDDLEKLLRDLPRNDHTKT